jgi:hypothetical protein
MNLELQRRSAVAGKRARKEDLRYSAQFDELLTFDTSSVKIPKYTQ